MYNFIYALSDLLRIMDVNLKIPGKISLFGFSNSSFNNVTCGSIAPIPEVGSFVAVFRIKEVFFLD